MTLNASNWIGKATELAKNFRQAATPRGIEQARDRTSKVSETRMLIEVAKRARWQEP
jgi:hypothetical protein